MTMKLIDGLPAYGIGCPATTDYSRRLGIYLLGWHSLPYPARLGLWRGEFGILAECVGRGPWVSQHAGNGGEVGGSIYYQQRTL